MGIFKSTRYDYYYTQSLTNVNDGYLSDPISTYAASAVASNQEIGQFVISKIADGMGTHLRQYYQFSHIRFPHTDWKYSWSTNTKNNQISDRVLHQILGSEYKYSKLVSITESFEPDGEYSDYLKSINSTDIPEPSKGITLMLASEPSVTTSQETLVQDNPNNYQENQPKLIKTDKNIFTFDSIESSTDSVSEDGVEQPVNTTEVDVRDTIIETYRVLKQEKIYQYTKTIVIDYTEFKYLYITQSGSTNEPKLQQIFNLLGSDTEYFNNKFFKFYPFIPLKEWDGTKGDYSEFLFNAKDSKQVNTIKKLNEHNEEKTKEDQDSDVRSQKYSREEQRIKDAKERKLARDVQRALTRDRNIKVETGLRHPLYEMTNGSLKRKLIQMGQYLNVDVRDTTSTLVADKNSGEIREVQIMPAVTLQTNHNDVMAYWFHFWRRMYNALNQESYFTRFQNKLENLTSINDLPLNIIKYKNNDQQWKGGFAFLFIRKLTISGSVKWTKRLRRKYDIRRGLPTKVTLEQLKQIIEPSQELANDEFYERNSQKDYCIGGQEYSKYGAFYEGALKQRTLDDYDYTFFCKQSGSSLEVYAVAGLSFSTKADHQYEFWGRAHFDLNLLYTRNKKKFVEKSTDSVFEEIRRKVSRKKRDITRLQTFSCLPLDYHTVRRMGGAELERFAPRAIVTHLYAFSEVKRKAKWVGHFFKWIGAVIAVVVAIYDWTGETSSSAYAFFTALAKGIATAVVANLVVKYGVIPLLRALGAKGIIAVIILMIIALVTSYGSGYNPNMSSLPYASQTATSQVASKAVQETVKTTLTETVKATVRDIAKEITLRSVLQTGLNASFQAYGQVTQDAIKDIQNQMNQENKNYLEAQEKLEDLQNQLQNNQASYDVKEVMSYLRLRFKLEDPTNQLVSLTDSTDFLASYDYLKAFLDTKLDLDVERFDPINSLDFSVKYNRS